MKLRIKQRTIHQEEVKVKEGGEADPEVVDSEEVLVGARSYITSKSQPIKLVRRKRRKLRVSTSTEERDATDH